MNLGSAVFSVFLLLFLAIATVGISAVTLIVSIIVKIKNNRRVNRSKNVAIATTVLIVISSIIVAIGVLLYLFPELIFSY